MIVSKALCFCGSLTSLLSSTVRHLKPYCGISASICQFAAQAIHLDSLNLDGEEWMKQYIIEDRNLLRKSEFSKDGLYVLDLVDNGSLEADRTLYSKLLKRCAQLRNLKDGKIVHAHFVNSKFRNDIVFLNLILKMYANCGSMGDAQQVFDAMRERDLVAWTSMITGYTQNEQGEKALALFPEMLQYGLKPNEFALSSLVKASGLLTSELHGKQVHAFSLKCGNDLNVFVATALVDMYARCGQMHDAELIFDGLEQKNEVSWNALIAGNVRMHEHERALSLFLRMQREYFEPTQYTYSSLLCACSGIGTIEQGKSIHAHLIKSGEKLVTFVGNTLLHMYAKAGSIEDAKLVFDRLVKQDVVSWNSMLIGYAQHGLGMKAVHHFEMMRKAGVQPNNVTFLCLLTACSRSGLLDHGQYYFELMNKYHIQSQASHYVTMVDLLGRAGLLDRAKKFIEEMPIEPTAAVWGALLGACRMHKDMDMGVYAAERIFEIDPFDSGPHVLLANIYASAGRWSDVAKVRKMMKESGVKKEPACSWIEIENTTHVFVADDNAHPQKDAIRSMWDKLSDKIKEIGYVPDTSHVLLFVDEREKEAKLQYHSEKLALSFALLCTPVASTIRIMKNIRVCGDCHSAIKYVSMIVDREIIVRDTNRFHHFRNGHCSCGDYW